VNHFFEINNYIDDVLLLGIVITIGYGTTLCWLSFSQEYMTNVTNETGTTIGGHQTNQIGGGPLEQV
jgi:hypothetical protein